MPKDVGPSEKRISNPNGPVADRSIPAKLVGIVSLHLGRVFHPKN